MTTQDKHPAFVTTYHPVAGWKSICYAWNDEIKDYEPWNTSYFAYSTKEEAVKDAKDWAEAEELEYKES